MATHSASAVIDAVVSTLTSASEFSAEDVSDNDYHILTTAPGACAVVVRFRGMDGIPRTFGTPRPKTSVTTVRLEGFVRDTGDSRSVLEQVTRLSDSLFNVFHHDPTLSGVVQICNVDTITVNTGVIAEAGGFRWVPIVGTLRAEQF